MIDDPTLTPAENAAAAVAERARVFGATHFPPPLPPVPDVPASRYDTCACGQPRFMHRDFDAHRFDLAEAYHPSWLNPHRSDASPEGGA